jgi:hypothetical protein
MGDMQPYKTKTEKAMPTALAPLAIATTSIINTPAQKPVCTEFMIKNELGFSASRRKRRMARMSMSRTITIKSMKTMTTLERECQWNELLEYG